MLRGAAADVGWRRQTMARANRPVGRIALATAGTLLLPLLAMLFTNDVRWGVFDFVFAAALLGGTGLLVHALVTRKAGNIVLMVLTAAVGVAAIVLGEMDDAPGLVGFGCLVIGGTAVLAYRKVQRSS
jgi:hypothetical protein